MPMYLDLPCIAHVPCPAHMPYHDNVHCSALHM